MKSYAVFFFVIFFTYSTTKAQTELSTITVRPEEVFEASESSGFLNIPAREVPMSNTTLSSQVLEEQRVHRLSDAIKTDASLSDSYNATGYWDFISIRGITLDNRENFQREGLPISAETSLPLDNKERIEILKGLGGIQAGASTPGGLVNYVVKRPPLGNRKTIKTEISGHGNALLAVDVGGRHAGDRLGYRLGLAQEELRPLLRNATGSRSLVSGAVDWRLTDNSLLETEWEWSRRSQPSQAGLSLLGNQLPEPKDPNLNLNNQPWSQPVVFEGLTGTVKYSQSFDASTSWAMIVGMQKLVTDDRLAYPYGCSVESNYDRFCSDGSFDLYDYRSENEKRDVEAAKVSLNKQFLWGESLQQVSVGILASQFRERYQKQAYNFVGVGRVDGSAITNPDPTLTGENTNRDSKNGTFFYNQTARLGAWQLWWGLRWLELQRQSERTDGSRKIDFTLHRALPWGALSYEFEKKRTYLSFGEGLESFVTPNKSGYAHPGEFIPDAISDQVELGLRGEEDLQWGVALFLMQRPFVEDQKPLYQVDGKLLYRGVELEARKEWSSWRWGGSVLFLEAQREGSSLNTAMNGKKPVNVPENALRTQVEYIVPGGAGLSLNARLSHEGTRAVLPDNSLWLSAWNRWDAGVKYQTLFKGSPVEMRLDIENIMDQRYWRESPTQYGHVYLYPGESRNIYFTLQADL